MTKSIFLTNQQNKCVTMKSNLFEMRLDSVVSIIISHRWRFI